MKKVLLIIASQDFRDEEYFIPLKNFKEAGFVVLTASSVKGKCYGKLGGYTESDLILSEVVVNDYDAIVFVGGIGVIEYQKNKEAHRIIKEAVDNGKILSAICIAPTILAHAGVLKGSTATVWNDDGEQEKLFKSLGVNFTNEDVTIDGNLITANGPKAANKFSLAVIDKVKSKQD